MLQIIPNQITKHEDDNSSRSLHISFNFLGRFVSLIFFSNSQNINQHELSPIFTASKRQILKPWSPHTSARFLAVLYGRRWVTAVVVGTWAHTHRPFMPSSSIHVVVVVIVIVFGHPRLSPPLRPLGHFVLVAIHETLAVPETWTSDVQTRLSRGLGMWFLLRWLNCRWSLFFVCLHIMCYCLNYIHDLLIGIWCFF